MEDANKLYDSHLLAGHFLAIDELDRELIILEEEKAESLIEDAKNKKGQEKVLLLSQAFLSLEKSLILYDLYRIDDDEGVFCFLFTRYPELEFDWTMMQKILYALKNNSVNYEDQKTLGLALTLYISSLKEKIKSIKQ